MNMKKYKVFIPRTQVSGIVRYDLQEYESLEEAYLTYKGNPKSFLVKDIKPKIIELLEEIEEL